MTGGEMIEAAFSPEGSREFAVVIPYEDIFIRDHYGQLTVCPWWYGYAPDVERKLQWYADALRAIGQDWLMLPFCPTRQDRAKARLVEKEDGPYLVDVATGKQRRLHLPRVSGSLTGSYSAENVPRTIEEVEARLPIPRQTPPDEWLADGRGDLAAALLEGPASGLYPIAQVLSPLWSCYDLWGFEELMITALTAPELLHCACERLLAGALNFARGARALGCRGIWIEDCMTDMMSPKVFGEINLPYVRALVEGIRELGMHSIYYYCGNPMDRLEELVAAGADALSLEESKKGFDVDVAEVCARVAGRCAVLGNLDPIGVLEKGSEGRLRSEIGRQIEAGRRNGGRFVMSLGSPVTPGTPVERVRLYCDIAHELGRAG